MDRASGDLTQIERAAVPGTDKPSPTSIPMAVSPDRRFSVRRVAQRAVSGVELCDRPGERAAHPSRQRPPRRQHGLYRDRPSGRFLLSASYPGAKLAINPIDARAGSASGRHRCCRPSPRRIASSSTPRTITSTAPISAATSSCSCGSTHAPARCRRISPPSISTKPNAGPRHLAFHPNGRFLYLLNETDATLGIYAVDAGHRHARRVADRSDPAARFHRQAVGGRPARHPGRAVHLCERADDEHDQGVSPRPRARHVFAMRAVADRDDAARLCDRPAQPFFARRRAQLERDERRGDRPRHRRARRGAGNTGSAKCRTGSRSSIWSE